MNGTVRGYNGTPYKGSTKNLGINFGDRVWLVLLLPMVPQVSPEIQFDLQHNVRLLGISPMIRPRLLVSERIILHELHGILQVAMGGEGIHLFQSNIWGVIHAGLYLQGQSVGALLSDARIR